MNTPMDSTDAFAHDDALGHFRARADEAIVLDDHRSGLQRLEHAADADAARDVAVLADLRARAHRRPGVDHGAGIHIGAEIDERGHQHHARRDIGRAAHHAARHGAKAGGAEVLVVPIVELRRDFVPPGRVRRAAEDDAHVIQTKRQQYGFLEPLIDAARLPSAARSATRAVPAVEQIERLLDRLAHGALGRRSNVFAPLKRGIDGFFKFGCGHEGIPCCRGLSEDAEAMSSNCSLDDAREIRGTPGGTSPRVASLMRPVL